MFVLTITTTDWQDRVSRVQWSYATLESAINALTGAIALATGSGYWRLIGRTDRTATVVTTGKTRILTIEEVA